MRILLVVSHGYEAGGAEKSVLMMKHELSARGHEVAVLSAATPGRATFSDYHFERVPAHSPLKWLHHMFYLRSYRAMRDAVANFRPDIIHFHTLTACTPSVLFATRGVPAVLTIHGPEEFTVKLLPWFLSSTDTGNRTEEELRLTLRDLPRYAYYRFAQRPIYLLGLRHVSRVIAPSRYIAGQTAADFRHLQVTQIYNGIELPAPAPLAHQPRLLYVGRLNVVKGVSYLLQAFAEVADELPSLTLRIVGNGPDQPELERLAGNLGIAGRTDFAGWVASDQIPAEYAAATAVVIPSVWPENLPTVCIEAMAVGRPVIGTRTGGIPELIQHEKTGLLVHRANVKSLATAIRGVFAAPELAASMGAAGAVAAGQYSAEHFINQIEALYREVAVAGTDSATAPVR